MLELFPWVGRFVEAFAGSSTFLCSEDYYVKFFRDTHALGALSTVNMKLAL